MSMDKLIVEVTECIEREYGRAAAKFGPTNHSDHESYAVLLEEFQEACVEVKTVEERLSVFWRMVKTDHIDDSKYDVLMKMEQSALFGACELIQVAAMAKKAALTVCDRAAIKEFKEADHD